MGFVFVRNVLVFRERTFKPFFSGDFQDGPSWRSHGSEPGSQVGGRDGNRNGSRRRILAYLPVKRKDEHLGGLGRKRERGRKKRWVKVGLKVEVEKIGGEADRPLVNLHGKCIKDWLSPPPPPSVSTLFLSSPFLCLSQLFFSESARWRLGESGVCRTGGMGLGC